MDLYLQYIMGRNSMLLSRLLFNYIPTLHLNNIIICSSYVTIHSLLIATHGVLVVNLFFSFQYLLISHAAVTLFNLTSSNFIIRLVLMNLK